MYNIGLKQDKIQVMKDEPGPSSPTTDQNLHNASASPDPQFWVFVGSG